MADDLSVGTALRYAGFGAKSTSSASGNGTGLLILMIIFACVLLFILIYILINMAKYKHTFVIKDKTSGVPITHIDKAKIVFEKNGTEKSWKLFKMGVEVPVPPDWSREQTSKGNFMVSTVRSTEKGFLYKDPKSGKTVLEYKEKDGKPEFVYVSPSSENTQMSTEELTTNTKGYLLQQFQQAKLEEPPLTWQDIANKAMFPATVVIILIIFMLFYGNLAKPVIEAQQQYAEIGSQYSQILAKEEQILARMETMITGQKTFSSQEIEPDKVRPD